MFKIKPAPPEATGPRLAWGPGPSLPGSANTATPSPSHQQVHAGQGASKGGTRIDVRTVSPLHHNPVLTPVSMQSNVIPVPDFDAEAQAEALAPTAQDHSDSESRSVLPVDAAPQQPEPSGLRRVATKALMGSLPVIAGIALMVDGNKEDDDAELAAGAALLAGTLAGMAIDSLVDRVMAWCGGGATAS